MLWWEILLCVLGGLIGLIVVPLLIMAITGVIYRATSGKCTSTMSLAGKTVIITGASAGLGKQTAYDLAGRDARIIMACRNLDKANKIKDAIIAKTGNNNIVVRQIDVSDLESVRKFAYNIIDTEANVHILINNAGMMASELSRSKEGFEMTMATNHYGHFLLTNILLGLLKRSAPSRIVNISSLAHITNDIDIDDLNYHKRNWTPVGSYSQSKLCNILFTKGLASRLQDTGVTVNCLHPGLVFTEFASRNEKISTKLFALMLWIFGKNEVQGAQTTIHLAVSEKVDGITGQYYVDCKKNRSSSATRNEDLIQKFWEFSERDVTLLHSERHFD